MTANNYKVKLVSVVDPRSRVIFEATPTFTENRSVSYTPVTPVHMPGSIQVYKNTAARAFNVGAKLISRTREDATRNMRTLQLLRGWTMPYFGASGGQTGSEQVEMERQFAAGGIDLSLSASSLLGAPPDVLYLYAYSSEASRMSGELVNINKIPVVIDSLNISYPDDVDYIPTDQQNAEPFPVRMEVSIALVETHSPVEYERFSLADFKNGKLVNF